MLWLAGEALAQHRILRRNPDRAAVEMTFAHHDAARRDQRRGGEPELVGAKDRGNGDVAARPQSPVRLHPDTAPQAVEDQGLLGLGQPNLPRQASVGQRRQRCGSGAPVKTGDGDMVGHRLGDTGGNGADADLANQFD